MSMIGIRHFLIRFLSYLEIPLPNNHIYKFFILLFNLFYPLREMK